MPDPDFDAWARETPDTPAGRVLAYLDARTPWAAGEGTHLPDGIAYLSDPFNVQLSEADLREVLRERDQLAAALRVEKLRSQSAERLLAEALREQQVTADLRAARDMFRRPEQAGSVVHFSPGHDGDMADHTGPADTCPMPACRTANLRNAAADAIRDANPNGRDPE